MKIYLDNCCFNRPFDDQNQLRIKLEAEAKLRIQEEVRLGNFQLVWSYILDYENNKNPYLDRKLQIGDWKQYADMDIEESEELIAHAHSLQKLGLGKLDSMHVACAIQAKCDYFLTTDDKILKRYSQVSEVAVTDPIVFIKEVIK